MRKERQGKKKSNEKEKEKLEDRNSFDCEPHEEILGTWK
jgi:hypothetical protein